MQSPIPSNWPVHSRRQYSSALVIPGPSIKQLRTTPVAQSPPKLFKLANPKRCPLLPSPHKSLKRSWLWPSPHSCLLSSDLPGVFPLWSCVMCWALCLEGVFLSLSAACSWDPHLIDHLIKECKTPEVGMRKNTIPSSWQKKLHKGKECIAHARPEFLGRSSTFH